MLIVSLISIKHKQNEINLNIAFANYKVSQLKLNKAFFIIKNIITKYPLNIDK